MISVMTDVFEMEVEPKPASRAGVDVRVEDGNGGKMIVTLTMRQAEELALGLLEEVKRYQSRLNLEAV
jgi:hypothetical protein